MRSKRKRCRARKSCWDSITSNDPCYTSSVIFIVLLHFAKFNAAAQHPNRQNTPPSHKHIEFVVWCLEVSLAPSLSSLSISLNHDAQRTIDLLPATNPAIDTICLCIDLKSSRDDGGKAPPIAIGEARQVLHVLQTFYCERLGRAVCVRVPSLFWLFFKLISPLVDPVTKEKIRFNEDARKVRLVVPSGLCEADSCVPVRPARAITKTVFRWGLRLRIRQSFPLLLSYIANFSTQQNHEVYFPALVKLCAERKAANLERWRKYGEGKCGLSETVIRGAVVPAGAEE